MKVSGEEGKIWGGCESIKKRVSCDSSNDELEFFKSIILGF